MEREIYNMMPIEGQVMILLILVGSGFVVGKCIYNCYIETKIEKTNKSNGLLYTDKIITPQEAKELATCNKNLYIIDEFNKEMKHIFNNIKSNRRNIIGRNIYLDEVRDMVMGELIKLGYEVTDEQRPFDNIQIHIK